MEPVTTILSIVNGTFTLAQSISAFHSAPDELKNAIATLVPVQEQIERAIDLRNRAFDITSANTGENDTFLRVQSAIGNAKGILKACAKTLNTEPFEEKVPGLTRMTRKSRGGNTKTRFTWVLGGKSTFNASMQSLQIHYQSLLDDIRVLEKRLDDMGQKPPPAALPFGNLADFTKDMLELPDIDDISYWVGPRKSGELSSNEEEKMTVPEATETINVQVIETADSSKVDDTFLTKLKIRR